MLKSLMRDVSHASRERFLSVEQGSHALQQFPLCQRRAALFMLPQNKKRAFPWSNIRYGLRDFATEGKPLLWNSWHQVLLTLCTTTSTCSLCIGKKPFYGLMLSPVLSTERGCRIWKTLNSGQMFSRSKSSAEFKLVLQHRLQKPSLMTHFSGPFSFWNRAWKYSTMHTSSSL